MTRTSGSRPQRSAASREPCSSQVHARALDRQLNDPQGPRILTRTYVVISLSVLDGLFRYVYPFAGTAVSSGRDPGGRSESYLRELTGYVRRRACERPCFLQTTVTQLDLPPVSSHRNARARRQSRPPARAQHDSPNRFQTVLARAKVTPAAGSFWLLPISQHSVNFHSSESVRPNGRVARESRSETRLPRSEP
ncbi:hypothetical protein K466DRAFT_115392 [Polyporus arcularius HHB13444]|uniref:Uncharacterized protein n=1 Tax=Polyporus arcularius HHB13444 TaxID=1314778 RepID=A0A5C3PE73_9APHY|nr:hypothetical protein K466DRAFT_115392 [Polyporus arcularius HHB13444]